MDRQQQQRDEMEAAFRTQARTEKAWTLFMALIATGSSPGEAMRNTEDALRIWIEYEEEHIVRTPFLMTGNALYPVPPGSMDVRIPNPPPILDTDRDRNNRVSTSPRVFNPGAGTVSGSMYGTLLWPITMEKRNGAESYPVALCWDLASAEQISDALNDAKANGHMLALSKLGKL